MSLTGWKKWDLDSGKFYGIPCDIVFQAFKEALNERLRFYSRYTNTLIDWTYGEVKNDVKGLMNYIDGTLDGLIPGFLVPDNQLIGYQTGYGIVYSLSTYSIYPPTPTYQTTTYLWDFLGEKRIDSRSMDGMEYTAFLPWAEQVFKVINMLDTLYARPVELTGTMHHYVTMYRHAGHGVIVFDGWTEETESGGYESDINYAFGGLQSYQAYGSDTGPSWFYDNAWHGHNVPAGMHEYVTDVAIKGKKLSSSIAGSYAAIELVSGQKLKYKVAEKSYVWQPMEVYQHTYEAQKSEWTENQVVTINSGLAEYNGTALNINLGTIGSSTFRPAPAPYPSGEGEYTSPSNRFSWNGAITEIYINISPVFEYSNDSTLE